MTISTVLINYIDTYDYKMQKLAKNINLFGAKKLEMIEAYKYFKKQKELAYEKNTSSNLAIFNYQYFTSQINQINALLQTTHAETSIADCIISRKYQTDRI